jgi:pyruvate/2-oxoacid:ferredoxin oxidoreductase alpha subunit
LSKAIWRKSARSPGGNTTCLITGAPDAERVIIAMGSVCDTVQEVVDTLNAAGEKVGLLSVHLFRPFRWPTFRAAAESRAAYCRP